MGSALLALIANGVVSAVNIANVRGNQGKIRSMARIQTTRSKFIPMLTIRETCRLCDSRDSRVVLELPPTPIGDRYTETPEPDVERFPLTLIRCTACGLLQLREVIDPETLYGHYRYRTGESLGLSAYFDRYVAEIAPVMVTNRMRPHVVDIGSNDGTLLRAFQRRGYIATGVDPIGGPDTLQGAWSLTASKLMRGANGQADIITANNVLANADDVHGFMEGVRNLLAPDGIFVCETGSGPDLISSRLYDCIYHEHLSYFGLNQLRVLFGRHGLKIIKAVHTESKGGCLRIIASHGGDGEGVLSDLALEQRDASRLEEAGFRRHLENTKLEVKRWLVQHPERVWHFGYGASVGVTTLRYALGLGGKINPFLDDNQSRRGLFVPGAPVQVFMSDELYERPAHASVVILLAWRYADVILAKHQAFLEAGGVILQPLPTLTVHTAESYARRILATGNPRTA